jgi:hypothetical protein
MVVRFLRWVLSCPYLNFASINKFRFKFYISAFLYLSDSEDKYVLTIELVSRYRNFIVRFWIRTRIAKCCFSSCLPQNQNKFPDNCINTWQNCRVLRIFCSQPFSFDPLDLTSPELGLLERLITRTRPAIFQHWRSRFYTNPYQNSGWAVIEEIPTERLGYGGFYSSEKNILV